MNALISRRGQHKYEKMGICQQHLQLTAPCWLENLKYLTCFGVRKAPHHITPTLYRNTTPIYGLKGLNNGLYFWIIVSSIQKGTS